ncbi:MAG: VOC family protein [Sphingomonadales bacterium]|nr:VOC family protein [Sphingomonadales bacterium]
MAQTPLVTAMACMTVAAADPASLFKLLREGMGWEVCAEGAVDEGVSRLWGVSGAENHGPFFLLRSPGAERGMIRIVRGTDRFPERPIGARWSGVEIVVMNDIDGLYERLAAMPEFQVTRPPDNADFSDVGANIHRFFHGRASGGTHLMFTMEVTKPRDYAFPAAEAQVGHVFSIPLVSTDYATSRRFYENDLAMVSVLDDHLTGGIWHETWDLPEGTPVDLSILKGNAPGFGWGGVELQGYEPAVVDPVPWSRDRLDGGACLATFTADDIDATHRALEGSARCTCLGRPVPIDAPPYNGGRVFAAIGPNGERLEFCERFAV